MPQGSTLGRLLFLLYINDLPRSSKKLIFKIFADDTNSFYSSNNKSKRNPVVHAFARKCSPQVLGILCRLFYFQFVGDLYRPVSWYCMYLAPLTGLLWIFLCDARINLASSMLRMLQDCQYTVTFKSPIALFSTPIPNLLLYGDYSFNNKQPIVSMENHSAVTGSRR